MQTLNFSIEIPQNRAVDIKMIRQKVMDYAIHLVYASSEREVKVYEDNKSRIKVSEEVAWFKNHPVILSDDDIDDKAKYILDK